MFYCLSDLIFFVKRYVIVVYVNYLLNEFYFAALLQFFNAKCDCFIDCKYGFFVR